MPNDADRELLLLHFAAAAELPATERAPFVERVCREHPAIGRELRELLQIEAHDLGGFLVQPAVIAPDAARLLDASRETGPDDGAAPPDVGGTEDAPPATIGPYRILAQLGSGGMGVVYLAEQTAPVRRRVALKVIRLGLDSRQVLKRFVLERQSLALMSHPYVATVHDAGTTERGQPYFVMEHVDGVPLTDFCDRHELDLAARIELFRKVCEGVQHAHHKGVIHRDLKPGNVLVTGGADDAIPKIIDFGLARATDQAELEHSVLTERGLMLGTPEYMSPEQAGLDAASIDTRTDVYSLGVILYELLAGALPFPSEQLRSGGFLEIARILREVEPPKPSTRVTTRIDRGSRPTQHRRATTASLSKSLRGDLDWIVMRAIAKEPARRYGSPEALADDLARFLRNEPVTAGPPSTSYRLGKWLRRYRLQATAAATVLLAILGGLGAALWQADRALVAERDASLRADLLAQEQQRVVAERDRADAENRRFRLVRHTIDLDERTRQLQAMHPDPETWRPDWRALLPQLTEWLERCEREVPAAAADVAAALAELRGRATAPAAEPDGVPQFADGTDRFLFETLQAFQRQHAQFEHPMEGMLANARWQLRWAQQVDELTARHPHAAVTWADARVAIAKADGVVASRAYAAQPIDLAPQEGMVPIGKNPVTGLWEFYHLRSAWRAREGDAPTDLRIPQHDPKTGAIAVDDDTGIVFVLLPGGTFAMGAQSSDPTAPNFDPKAEDDAPVRQVTLAPFFLARHELTQLQWVRLSRDAGIPNRYPVGFSSPELQATITGAHPIEFASWSECEALLAQHGLLLPTEAQWEFAARAGTTTRWSTGSDPSSLEGADNILDRYAERVGPWSGEFAPWDDGFLVHAPVDRFRPNPWGLFGMLGNVGEWCRDPVADYAEPPRAGDGLRVPAEPKQSRIARGGSFDYGVGYARASLRFRFPSDYRNHNLGLRAARALRP